MGMEGKKETVTVLKTDYFDDFACTASDCPQVCCKGWRICVNAKTYEKYRELERRDGVSLTEHLKPGANVFKGDYEIKLNERGLCPFLTEERLCGLQRKYGAEVLSTVCLEYPRVYNVIDGTLELSLTLSCHEVSRIVLHKPEGISFRLVEEDVEKYRKKPVSFRWETANSIREVGYYFWELRMASVRLLQCRTMPLSDRIFFVGMMGKKVQELFDKVRHREVSSAIERFSDAVESGAYDDLTEQLPKNYEGLISAVNTVYRLQQSKTAEGFMNLVQHLYAPENFLSSSNMEKYEELTEILNREPCSYMLENFIVNEYFKAGFPAFGDNMLWDPAIFMASMYLRIKAGAFISYIVSGKMDGDTLFEILHQFALEYLHNSEKIEFLRSSIRFSEYNSLGALYTLML